MKKYKLENRQKKIALLIELSNIIETCSQSIDKNDIDDIEAWLEKEQKLVSAVDQLDEEYSKESEMLGCSKRTEDALFQEQIDEVNEDIRSILNKIAVLQQEVTKKTKQELEKTARQIEDVQHQKQQIMKRESVNQQYIHSFHQLEQMAYFIDYKK